MLCVYALCLWASFYVLCVLCATCLGLADAVEELLLLGVGPEDLVEHEGVLPVVVARVMQRQLHRETDVHTERGAGGISGSIPVMQKW